MIRKEELMEGVRFKQKQKIQEEAKTRKTTIRKRTTRLTTTTKTMMEPIHLAYIAKRQITHKGSVGGGLMSSAGNVVRLDTWSRFTSHNNMKRQKLLLSNIKKSNFLLQHASQQVTALAIPG